LAWTIEWDDRASKELKRLDRQTQREILRYFRERIATDEDPRHFGKSLRHGLQGLWRYRVGDYRMICYIEDEQVVVLVLGVGHRSTVYR
jgi:mRNA interferase RelE/StbE